MEKIFQIDWQSIFVPTESLLGIFIRGTILFLVMFTVLRIFRRQAGTVGIADLLVIVVIADAAQNGMTGEAKSVTEAVLLILTIVLWDYLLDWLGDKSQFFKNIIEPRELLLISDGKLLRRNMHKEMISYDELMSQLRQQGVEMVSEVKKCYLESNGRFSVLTYEKDSNKSKSKASAQTPVH
jgi:uncharacterized membrane protein YcaP (DUF421 family)